MAIKNLYNGVHSKCSMIAREILLKIDSDIYKVFILG